MFEIGFGGPCLVTMDPLMESGIPLRVEPFRTISCPSAAREENSEMLNSRRQKGTLPQLFLVVFGHQFGEGLRQIGRLKILRGSGMRLPAGLVPRQNFMRAEKRRDSQ